jgi:hypothetical protein
LKMTDREQLIRTYVQRQKDLSDIQERYKNCNPLPV